MPSCPRDGTAPNRGCTPEAPATALCPGPVPCALCPPRTKVPFVRPIPQPPAPSADGNHTRAALARNPDPHHRAQRSRPPQTPHHPTHPARRLPHTSASPTPHATTTLRNNATNTPRHNGQHNITKALHHMTPQPHATTLPARTSPPPHESPFRTPPEGDPRFQRYGKAPTVPGPQPPTGNRFTPETRTKVPFVRQGVPRFQRYQRGPTFLPWRKEVPGRSWGGHDRAPG
jgi:hypothetical protein